jgi:hypothetical protein
VRRAVLAGVLALLPVLAGPARAQSATDPVESVRAFYDKDDINALQFYAARLRALFARDRREAKGEVGRLDFAFHVNGQDTEEGWARTLTLTTVHADAKRAEVQARFRNGGAQEIRYDLVYEGGHWLIADARSLRGERWQLTKILSAPL